MKFAKPGERKTAENTKKKLSAVLNCTLHTKKQRFSLLLARKPFKMCYKRTKKHVFSEKRGKNTEKRLFFTSIS